jgi:NO-binding membrane sensor protein with MHYT domain
MGPMGPMGSTTEFGFGWVAPALSYVMACVGGALGLRCMVRALAAAGQARRGWLLQSSVAVGIGIWTMHFIAMIGFAVSGSAVRYDAPLTVASLLVSIAVVGFGVFVVAYVRSRTAALALGGPIMGVGVAAMHYLGMSAMHLSGSVRYDNGTVLVSVVIAVVAATVALWFTLTMHTPLAALGASLVMGVAVTAMHYTGMAAAHVHVDSGAPAPGGASGMDFIVPMTVVLGSYLFLAWAFVALSPTAGTRTAAARLPGAAAASEVRPTPAARHR